MGVLTSVCQVPLGVLGVCKRTPRLLDFFIYSDTVQATELGMADGWTAPRCGFDKEWEDLATILRQSGHRHAGSILEYGGTDLKYPGGDVYCRSWRKTKLKQIRTDLRGLTAAQLKTEALAVSDLTDWDGEAAHDMLDYYLQSFDELHAMILATIDQGDALIALSS
ncbi:MAG: hypothetical protein ACI8S6_003442 [Myxococcota bacterium]